MQECPYKNNNKLQRLPCNYCEHPTKEYIFLCRTCTNWYDVRDVGSNRADDGFWLIIGGLILLLVLVSNGFFEHKNTDSAPETPTLKEIQD